MTGTERKRAWRLRQKQNSTPAVEQQGSEPRLNYPVLVASILKTLRTEVRLKHSLAADNELGDLIPAAIKFCGGLMQRGHRPTLEAVKKLVAGGKYPR